MLSSKLIKLVKTFLLLLIIILIQIIYDRYRTYSFIPPPSISSCSFDNISACQMIDNRMRTFLYISWNRAGFCSELNQILLAFAYSIFTKRYFLIDSHLWNYGNLTDYFNLSSMNYHHFSNHTLLTDDNHINNRISHLKTTRIGTQLHKLWIAARPVQSLRLKRKVGHYLWRSISNETKKFFQTCQIKKLSNYIGIHIRRGDKVGIEARAIPLEKYIESIHRLFQKDQKLRSIFVASDDHTIVNQLRQLNSKWHFLNIHQNFNRTRKQTGHSQFDFNLLSKKEKLFETRLLMCELQMLIDSKYVICGMSSNVCRLIQTLRYQHPSTVISLDGRWRAT
ncbi:hypothetical protein I4U23_025767 [Adineta vaga]|nr:hypothetical protein I4U23_025767 [Adineta vaga]